MNSGVRLKDPGTPGLFEDPGVLLKGPAEGDADEEREDATEDLEALSPATETAAPEAAATEKATTEEAPAENAAAEVTDAEPEAEFWPDLLFPGDGGEEEFPVARAERLNSHLLDAEEVVSAGRRACGLWC